MKATITTEARYLFAKSEVSLVVLPATVFVKIDADGNEEEVMHLDRTSAKHARHVVALCSPCVQR